LFRSAGLVAAAVLSACSEAPLPEAAHGVVHLADRLRFEDGSAPSVARHTFRGIGMEAVEAPAGAKLLARVTLPKGRSTLRMSVAATGPEGAVQTVVLGVRGGRITLEDRERWKELSLEIDGGGTDGGEVEIVLSGEGPAGTTLLWGSPVIAGARARADRGDVVLYEIDTLRADLLETYGYPGRSSPEIGALARRGVLFAECQAPSSWTRPSAVSILTSLSVPSHGVVDEELRLPDGVPTLADALRAAGWYTVAFQTNPNAGRPAGLDRGFDVVFEMNDLLREASERSAEWRGTKQLSNAMASGTSELIAFRLAKLLPEWGDLPLFLYVHPNDPHAPYDPREPFASLPGFDREGAPERVAKPVRSYGRDVRSADWFLGDIADMLETAGRLETAAFALVSDHGEEFREHDRMGHGIQLFAETQHVPLVLVAPGRVPAGRASVGRVSALDLAPTLLELAGVAAPPGIEGRSLLASLSAGDAGRRFPHDPSFAHVVTMKMRLDDTVMADPAVIGTLSVMRGKWKCVVQDYASHRKRGVALFDLAADPRELVDVAAANPKIAAEMEAEARTWWSERRAAGRETVESGPDAEAVEQLRALGYVQ
jgi:arylsulfatase A-like enzyme